MVGTAIVLAVGVRSEFPQDGEETAAIVKPAAPEQVASAGAAPAAAAAAPQALPTDEEIAKSWPRFRGPGGLGISAYTQRAANLGRQVRQGDRVENARAAAGQ